MTDEIKGLNVVVSNIFYVDLALLHTHPTLFDNPNPQWFIKHARLVDNIYSTLNDAVSKQIMNDLLNYWICGDYSLIQRFCEMQKSQYLDTLHFSDDEVFVNVGACDGRYTKLFCECVKSYNSIYNLECDPVNFDLLEKNMASIKRCINLKIGVWNEHKLLKFQADGNSGSHISGSGDIEIEVDSIDNIFNGKRVTFIKADVEGAEYKLLEGAKHTISQWKPKLAICCYHQMNDIVMIPYTILKMNPDYKVKIRHYTDTLTETVCYAE